jgi:hypothetical protein
MPTKSPGKPATMHYIARLPRKLPKGRVIVHNRVHALWEDQPLGYHGFRAWTVTAREAAQEGWKPCRCGWSGLPHYRSAPDGMPPPPSCKGKHASARLVHEIWHKS